MPPEHVRGRFGRQGRVRVLSLLALLAALVLGLVGAPAARPAQAQTGCQELIVNGGFEDGHTGWNEYSSEGYELISSDHPNRGDYSAWIVAVNNEEGWIRQKLVLPTSGGTLRLSYWWSLITQENPGAFDFLKVQLLRVDGTLLATLATYSNEDADSHPWNPGSADLSPYAGETVLLRFWAKNDPTNETSFFVDDVSIEACPAGGTWTPTPTGPPTITPSVTPTSTVTPGPSPTPSPTPRNRLYLPLIVGR